MTALLETPYRLEPCLPEQASIQMLDLVSSLVSAAENLGNRLHPVTAANLADLVRIMNCYYSNLIEGHNTLPRDIQRALADQFASEGQKRNLQIEARAHIEVQRSIDKLARSWNAAWLRRWRIISSP